MSEISFCLFILSLKANLNIFGHIPAISPARVWLLFPNELTMREKMTQCPRWRSFVTENLCHVQRSNQRPQDCKSDIFPMELISDGIQSVMQALSRRCKGIFFKSVFLFCNCLFHIFCQVIKSARCLKIRIKLYFVNDF